MPLHFEQFQPGSEAHDDAAKQISAWSMGEHMLPLSPEAMGGHVLGLLAYEGTDADGHVLVGYRAVTQEYDGGDVYEVGAMVVDPEQRGKGYGSEIAAGVVAAATEAFPGATLMAFCNERSAGISRRLGFEDVTDTADVPAAALELCTTCPMYNARPMGKICCDTILALRPTAA